MSQGNLSTSGVTTELWVYRTLSLLAEMPMHLRVTGQAGCQASALVMHTCVGVCSAHPSVSTRMCKPHTAHCGISVFTALDFQLFSMSGSLRINIWGKYHPPWKQHWVPEEQASQCGCHAGSRTGSYGDSRVLVTAVPTHERLSVLRCVCKPDATPIQSPTGPLVTVDAWLILHCDGCGTAKKSQDNDEGGYPDGLQGCDDTKRTAQSDRDSSSLGGARLREELAPRVSRTDGRQRTGDT